MILRILTAFLLTLHYAYWLVKGKIANDKKPKSKFLSSQKKIEKIVIRMIDTLVALQLFGLTIFSFPQNIHIQYFGFAIVLLGIVLSVSARREIDINWTGAYEYQIKKGHSLVTSGIYKYIRHPIYTGLFCIFLGAELLSYSYIFLLSILLSILLYYWGKREEKILLEHFGEKYRQYIKKTKMFIPFMY